MTVSNTTSRADYTGNGVTTAFAVPFYFLDQTHLTVLRTVIATGVSTTLVLGTDYTVAGAGVPGGGTVTCTTAPTAAQRISILRNVPLTQLTDYVPNDPFPAESHERALDQLTMIAQQVNEVTSRAIRVASADPSAPGALPEAAARANKVLVFDSAGQPGVSDAAALASVTAAAYATVQEFTGDGTTQVFTLSSVPGSAAMVDVAVGGVVQSPTLDYDVVGATLSFFDAPPASSRIIARWITSSGTPPGTAGNFVPISGVQGTAAEVRANAGALFVQGVGNGSASSTFVTRQAYSGNASNLIGNTERIQAAEGTVLAPTVLRNGAGLEATDWRGYDGLGFVTGARFRAVVAGVPASGVMPVELSWGVGAAGTNVSLRVGGQWRFHPMTAPSSPQAGDVYYDSGTNKLRCWNGTTWNDLF